MCQGRKIIDPKISIGNWVGKWPDKNRVQIGQKHRLGQKILTQKWEKSTRNWLDNFTIYSKIYRRNFLKIGSRLSGKWPLEIARSSQKNPKGLTSRNNRLQIGSKTEI